MTLVVWIMNFKMATPGAGFILLHLGMAGAIGLFLIASRGLIKKKNVRQVARGGFARLVLELNN